MHQQKQHSWYQLALLVLVLLLTGTYVVLTFGIKNAELTPPAATVSVSNFSDVAPGTYDAIVTTDLYSRGIFTGYTDGSFGLYSKLNRAEVAKILTTATGISALHGSADIPFKDVENSEWYAPYTAAVKQAGFVNGYPDGSYKPTQEISRVEYMKMLSEAFRLEKNVAYTYRDVNGAAWYAQYLGWYEQQGIFFPPMLLPSRPITRLEAARAMYAALQLSPSVTTTSVQQPVVPVQSPEPVVAPVPKPAAPSAAEVYTADPWDADATDPFGSAANDPWGTSTTDPFTSDSNTSELPPLFGSPDEIELDFSVSDDPFSSNTSANSTNTSTSNTTTTQDEDFGDLGELNFDDFNFDLAF